MDKKRTVINIIIGLLFIIIMYRFHTTISLNREAPKVVEQEISNIYIQTDYKCIKTNSRDIIAVKTLEEEPIDIKVLDKDSIKKTYIESGQLHIETGAKASRTTIQLMGSISNISPVITIDTYHLSIPEIGKQMKVDEEIETVINTSGTKDLICHSSNDSIATCRIENNKLLIKSNSKGTANIIVENYFEYNQEKHLCGTEDFMVVIR